MKERSGVAQARRREFAALFKTQAQRWLRGRALVKRDAFEAEKDMGRIAREENEALKVRVAALEAVVAGKTGSSAAQSDASSGVSGAGEPPVRPSGPAPGAF